MGSKQFLLFLTFHGVCVESSHSVSSNVIFASSMEWHWIFQSLRSLSEADSNFQAVSTFLFKGNRFFRSKVGVNTLRNLVAHES